MIKYVLFAFIVSICVLGAVVFGKFLPMTLPYIHPFFDKKPFNCRPCASFHLMWMLTGLFALLFYSLDLFAIGLIIAFLIYCVVRLMDKDKIVK